MNVKACRLANAAGRLMTSYQAGMVTLERMRSGGRQHVVVQYVHQHVEVGEGGQAMVAGQAEAGARRRAGRGRGSKDDLIPPRLGVDPMRGSIRLSPRAGRPWWPDRSRRGLGAK